MAGLPASHFPHRLMLNGTIRPRMCNNIAPSPASFCNQMFDQINTNWNFFRRPTLSDNDPIKVIDFLPKYSFPKRVTISPGNVLIFQIISRRNKQQTNNKQIKQTTNRPNKQQTDQTNNKQTKQATNRPNKQQTDQFGPGSRGKSCLLLGWKLCLVPSDSDKW